MYFRILFLISIIGISACVNTKKGIVYQNISVKDSIIFGEGGGFTGAVISWSIKNNGDIDSLDSEFKPVTKIGKIGAQRAQELIDEARKTLPQLPFENPGNWYQIVKVTNGNTVQTATFTETNTTYFALFQELKMELAKLYTK